MDFKISQKCSVMKLFFISLVLLVPSIFVASAQSLYYDIDFDNFFQNREYNKIDFLSERSATEFAARFSPSLELHFKENHSFNLGADLIALFTAPDKVLFDYADLVLYYGFDNEHWSASAGIFPRSRMAIDSYSHAFFTDDYLFFNNMVSGIMGQYRRSESFVEFVVDWESQPTETTREVFRLLSAGRIQWEHFAVGYNFSLTHFAGQEAEWMDQVVDNMLINPAVEYRIQGAFDFRARVGYLQSLQRDRSYGNEWLTPYMGEFGLRLSRWGVVLDNTIYLGENIEPLYDGQVAPDGTIITYGNQLYRGDECFRTEGGYYDRASIGYERSFLKGMLEVGAHFITHFVAEGIASEQLVRLKLHLNKPFKKRKDKQCEP